MNTKKKSLLYVAYHYPPIQGSSGVHRTLAFTRQLCRAGWQVNLLTTSLKAYAAISANQVELIPAKVKVIRAFARDTTRHLSIFGKSLDMMAVPDRWQSWIPFAVLKGLISIYQQKCAAIVSTYPIASAHFVGYFLHKLTGLPWIADLRDPMAQDNYPDDARVKRAFLWIERKMVKHCKKIVVTTPGALALYRQRYPETSEHLWQVLPNGYDETLLDAFIDKYAQKRQQPSCSQPIREKIRILHSGTIYPKDRDPRGLFIALQQLHEQQPGLENKLEVWLRATGMDDYYTDLISQYQLQAIVKLQPSLPFAAAIEDMCEADILLLLQAASCNYQIPAKVYEYIKVGKPILALTDPAGDTAAVVAQAPSTIAPINDSRAIKQALSTMLQGLGLAQFSPLPAEQVRQFSRATQAVKFEQLLNSVI